MSKIDLPQGTETHRAVSESNKVLSNDGASKGKGSDGKLRDMYNYGLGLMWRGQVEWQLSSSWGISVCVGICVYVRTHSNWHIPSSR